MVGAIEPRGRAAGELEDGRPLEVVALDVVRVVDGVCRVGVEEGRVGGEGGRDASVEDDGAGDGGVGALREGGSGQRCGGADEGWEEVLHGL